MAFAYFLAHAPQNFFPVNNGGDGRFFASKAEAIAHVEALRAQGRRNIDVGCMQINLMHHPDAFASLEEAFEPIDNVSYGADFLTRLRGETGSWDDAVARYHTADSARGQAYHDKVLERWDDRRLAEAVPRLQRRPPAPAGGPALFPRPPSTGSLASRGYLALTQMPPQVSVLRPGSLRPVRGVIRPDGTIEGSRLRLGPQRRAAVPAGDAPAMARIEPAAGAALPGAPASGASASATAAADAVSGGTERTGLMPGAAVRAGARPRSPWWRR